jgi:hypothetical protein
MSPLIIPDGVKWIGDEAFVRCDILFPITIPPSVEIIGTNAFIATVHLDVSPDNPNYSSIDGVLFNKHKTVLIQYPLHKKDTAFTIPESVTTIGPYAFFGKGLKSITVLNPIPPITELSSLYGNPCIYVPKGSIDVYRAADGWKDFRCIEAIAGRFITPDVVRVPEKYFKQ